MTQMTLTLEPGIGARHRSLRDCMAAGVYQRGLSKVAGQIDMAPSKLSEGLAGGSGDRPRDIGLDQFEEYLRLTGDTSPVLYLIDKYLRDPEAAKAEAVTQIAEIMSRLGPLLQQAGLVDAMPPRRTRR